MYPITYMTNAAQHRVAARLGLTVAHIEAVQAVESRVGFLPRTDKPAILFEGHRFDKLTRGKFRREHPTISYAKWTKAHYKGGLAEYGRLHAAIRLDAESAFKATSWGAFQILGENHARCGFATIQAFVDAMGTSEDFHLEAFGAFVAGDETMLEALRSERMAAFAERYNGPGYRANAYDTKIAAELAAARRRGDDPERGDVAAIQAALRLAAAPALVVDGWMGAKTSAAIIDFQRARGLPETGTVTKPLAEALGVDITLEEAA